MSVWLRIRANAFLCVAWCFFGIFMGILILQMMGWL